MKRSIVLAYGVVCYAIFFATFLYLVGFLGNLGVPKGIDTGVPGGIGALFVNSALILLFGLQHSVMARPDFKKIWTRIVPREVERSTYVLASSAVLIALFAAWQPLPGALWRVEDGVVRAALHGVFLLGVGTVLYATCLIDHFDLFGLRQVFLAWQRRSYSEKRFMTPSLYRFIRHPLYVGWFLSFWVTPDMTTGHLLFAAGMSAYILAAIPFEERDLAHQLGDEYRRYRARTPMFVPRLGRVREAALGAATPPVRSR
jgi:protein-S-isoprenylcysteine O-methyltransferase Ste14